MAEYIITSLSIMNCELSVVSYHSLLITHYSLLLGYEQFGQVSDLGQGLELADGIGHSRGDCLP